MRISLGHDWDLMMKLHRNSLFKPNHRHPNTWHRRCAEKAAHPATQRAWAKSWLLHPKQQELHRWATPDCKICRRSVKPPVLHSRLPARSFVVAADGTPRHPENQPQGWVTLSGVTSLEVHPWSWSFSGTRMDSCSYVGILEGQPKKAAC